jgi:FMN reductase
MPTSAEYLVISASLRSKSVSRVMAEHLSATYTKLGAANQLLDLREFPLPLCDGEAAYGHANLPLLAAPLQAARVILLATPIYNYDANAAVKNLIELTGKIWENKIVGFLCAAGGPSSYMSVMALANSLMLDFRCLVIPRFVYAHGEDFVDGKPSAKLAGRIDQLAEESLTIRRG